MSTGYIDLPLASGSGINTYANAGAFPVSAENGALAIALDTDTLYIFNTGSMTWVAIATPGAAIAIDALTGDVVASGPGIVAATIQPNVVTNAKLDKMVAFTIKGNNTASLSNPLDVALGSVSEATSSVLTITGTNNTVGSVTIQVKQSSTSQSGYLSSTDWNTFNNKQSTITLGNLTDVGTDGIVITGGTAAVVGSGTSIAQHVADATHNGYVNAADWNTFNNKQATITVGALDAQTANATGLALVSNVLSTQSADATHPGMINTTTQSFAGAKTFTGAISASNLSGTNSGDVTLTAVGATPNANGASLSGQSLTLQPANTSFPGVLLAADWNTFNSKQAAGNYITALTGDATAAGPGSVAITLATVNGNVGSFGSSTSIPSFTVNAKGLITAASGNVVIAPAGTLTGTTLNSTVVSSSLTSVGTITSGTWTGTTIAIANGGTGQTTASAAFNALSPMTTIGDIIYGGTSGAGTRLAVGATATVLTVAAGIPSWAAPSVALSSILAASTTNTIANANNAQVWNWDTLTTQTAMKLASTSMTSGSILALSSTFNSATSTGSVLNITASDGTSAAIPILITNGGTALSIDVAATGTGTKNALRLQNTVAAANNSGAGILFAANRTTSGLTNIAGVSGIITSITNGAYKGALIFSTANNAAPAERVRIIEDGSMGIGMTPGAGYTLDVNGQARVSGDFFGLGNIYSTDGTTYVAITTTGGKAELITTAGSTVKDISISPAGTTAMTIRNGGSVGINTTTSTEKLEVVGNVKLRHIIGSTSAPAIAAGTGAGTSPTISIAGTDAAGQISLTPGAGPATAATIATVTFNVAYGVAPYVLLTPGNAATAALGTAWAFISATSTTTFTLTSNAAALVAATPYVWYYHVIQ